jgi:hypothetical protein
MSLDKAIEHGKEHRKQYGQRRDFCKLIDYRCRNHGDCLYCKRNRLYNNKKREEKAEVKDE